MAENIFAGLMGLAVVAAGIWGFWLEHGSSKKNEKDLKKDDK